MITEIEGKFVEILGSAVILNVGGVFYEVGVSPAVLKKHENTQAGESVRLCTFHYLQSDPSRSVPVLIGFMNKIEREFFEKFITVSGIGPKAALKALNVPISQIARAIDCTDVAFLKTLPGVGEQRAREIIAKLQGKVGRFGLIQDGGEGVARAGNEDAKAEALAVLLQLQYRRDEAKQMIESALRIAPSVKTVEDLLNEVYRQRSSQAAGKPRA